MILEEFINRIPDVIWTMALLWLALVVYLVAESQFHRLVLKKIPHRVHVNGTRGKTSVVRLIAAGLREGGKRVFAKTSGTLTSVTDNNGDEFPVFRFSQPNIIEQLRVLRRLAKSKPEVVVMECMALQPRFQSLTELHMVKATHGVITNARPDHLDVMGPTGHDVALALAGSVPVNARLHTGARQHIEVFRMAVAERGSTIREVTNDEVAGVSTEMLRRFRYQEHAENVALALNVCEELGVDRDTALSGMTKLVPEPGATQIHCLDFHGREFVFVNAFAANDPESTGRIWESMVARYSEELGYKRIAIVNCRSDRPQRSWQMAEAAATWSRADHFVVIGTGTMIFLREANRNGISPKRLHVKETSSHADIIETILEVSESKALIVGMANIKGGGAAVVRFFANRAQRTEHL